MAIETKNLLLRKLSLADVNEQYVSWLNDEEVNKYLETRHVLQTLKSCKEFVDACNNDVCSQLFGIFLKADGSHIGNIKIGFINNKYKRGELRLLIGAKHNWGKGFGTEAVKALSKYSIDFLGLKKIEAGCYEDNVGSLRIFLKSGFVVEGFKRAHIERDGKRLGCFTFGLLANEIK
jgi:RimJ/RimL family protein N-acetyltransferase